MGLYRFKSYRVVRAVAGLALAAALLLGPALVAGAMEAGPAVVAQETPYQAPDINQVDPPDWLRPFQPLARLPLWGQAAVVSAAVAGVFFVVPMVGRWVWRIGEGQDREPRNGGVEG